MTAKTNYSRNPHCEPVTVVVLLAAAAVVVVVVVVVVPIIAKIHFKDPIVTDDTYKTCRKQIRNHLACNCCMPCVKPK